MVECLSSLEKYLHARSDLPVLVRLAMVHYQFEAIHPFLDGNGRIGRLLITLLLTIEDVLPAPLLYLSVYFEKNRPAYYRGLLRVSQHGEWIEWAEFFLRGVAEQSSDATRRAERLLTMREQFRERLLGKKGGVSALRLADELFARPAISVGQAATALGVTVRAGQLSVDKLVDAGILRESTGRRRNRVFVAEEIVRALE
jgi:Fic family protein